MPKNIKRKVVPQIYDADTAIGTNNSGLLKFTYSLEDTDQTDAVIVGSGTSGKADVFNGQKSVLWNNLRDCFRDDISNMYSTLRSDKVWTFDKIINAFESHQSNWCESEFNEDAWYKYIYPFIYPITEDPDHPGVMITTSKYLGMLQGDKRLQRMWWIANRFRYMDSKFITGDAASRFVSIRLFNNGTLRLTPVIDMYLSVRFGLGTTPLQERTTANTPAEFVYEGSSTVQEMETYIYSADLITDLGDLSQFYPNECVFTYCSRLRSIKLGSEDPNYSNGNLVELDASNCPMLESIDLRGATNLAQAINLEASKRLETGYFERTSISSVELADGCPIKTLHLPGSITTLILTNLDELTDFQIQTYENVTLLMLENISQDIVNPLTVLNAMQPHSWINITGLYLDLPNKADIDQFLALIETMDGVSRSRGTDGSWIYTHLPNNPIISGTIHTDSLSGADIAAYRRNYPYITFTADHVTAMINFKNADGSVTYETQTISNGGNATYSGTVTPTKESTAQYNYTFAGAWATEPNGTADPNALNAVWEDRNVYACFNGTVRYYDVKYYNNNTLLKTQSVAYGGSATPPADPTHWEDSERYVFKGWNPTGQNITGPTDCYAQYSDTSSVTLKYLNIVLDEISDAEDYKIKNLKPLVFTGYKQLKHVNFSEITYIPYKAFQGDSNLISINLPKVQEIRGDAFYGCEKLNNVSFPELTVLGSAAFNGCSKLTSVNLPKIRRVESQTFNTCTSLTNVVLPLVGLIASSAFAWCNKLEELDFQRLHTIENSAFYKCSMLKNIYLRYNSVVKLANSSIFSSVNESFTIHVPADLVDSYKSATNWSTYADKIVAI